MLSAKLNGCVALSPISYHDVAQLAQFHKYEGEVEQFQKLDLRLHNCFSDTLCAGKLYTINYSSLLYCASRTRISSRSSHSQAGHSLCCTPAIHPYWFTSSICAHGRLTCGARGLRPVLELKQAQQRAKSLFLVPSDVSTQCGHSITAQSAVP